MNILCKASLATAVALIATAPMALASSVSITTDRVQVRLGETGAVQIRTLSDRPLLLNADADRHSPSQLTPVPYSGLCSLRSHSHQTHSRPVTAAGDRVYTESHSSIRVCQ